ncbi:Pyruvate/2-oxoglutarate dehydrogenase complex, dihydrolipoamide dehydrogenase (E3) component [Rubritalea squalenifaciens DSM 18772]|uniref:Pyruvate/2-oxoglutarate dehydrogenase complex, dihydrolipoamide dehydrogenase (E3) component n=1 Tax=Rubritalea squalenifaciens DSM 18772 TaxID=1123071 RepID=A0A1M6I1M7_9BACT|nr:dihydrolipoyl dehydrogenase [Rubritalea squalenifaciens]SHJ28280.1 Pyruvate/2-oxoglutarate dehydrogenase complex, dihydrolipoamide dehydrogenase (E3) component [Rubritalea squalenifaciens DSM 18772]
MTEYDVAVIGGGSGGYAAARTAAAGGMKTVVVDGADELGGLCILRGCMPSKTLIESANRNIVIREAEEFGLKVDGSSVDTKKIIERKRWLIKDFSDYREGQLNDGRFDLLRGFARFEDANTLKVQLRDGGEEVIKAKTVIIASGSSIFVPEIPGLKEAGYLTSDDVLDKEDAPESVIVLGGGAIALELAHYYDGIGKRVTVIQRSEHLLTGMDHDVADELETALKDRGLEVFCGTKILKVDVLTDGVKRVTFEHKGQTVEVAGEEILVALGRNATSDKLALDKAGVALNKDKVKVEASMQTTAPNIFAAGDVCGPYEIVHIAIEQGEKAAENAMMYLRGCDPTEYQLMDYRLKLYGIFTEPQVATVGITEIEAAREGREVLVETYPFNDHGKSMVHGSKHGFVKLIGDAKTKEILGGAVVGPEGTELIHEIVVAMAFRATAGQLARIPHYHPTLSEIWTYPAEDIADA